MYARCTCWLQYVLELWDGAPVQLSVACVEGRLLVAVVTRCPALLLCKPIAIWCACVHVECSWRRSS
jgi:hypothetical protein